MKFHFSLVAMTTALIAGRAEGAQLKPFKCENQMYRQAVLEVGSDSSFRMADHASQMRESGVLGDLERVNRLPEGAFDGYQAELQVPAEKLECVIFGGLPMECLGRDLDGVLKVEGFLRKGDDSKVDLAAPVKVKSLKLKGILTTSAGSIVLGSGTTTVKLDQLDVDLNTVLEIEGGPRRVFELHAFFNVGKQQKDFHYCRF